MRKPLSKGHSVPQTHFSRLRDKDAEASGKGDSAQVLLGDRGPGRVMRVPQAHASPVQGFLNTQSVQGGYGLRSTGDHFLFLDVSAHQCFQSQHRSLSRCMGRETWSFLKLAFAADYREETLEHTEALSGLSHAPRGARGVSHPSALTILRAPRSVC